MFLALFFSSNKFFSYLDKYTQHSAIAIIVRIVIYDGITGILNIAIALKIANTVTVIFKIIFPNNFNVFNLLNLIAIYTYIHTIQMVTKVGSAR